MKWINNNYRLPLLALSLTAVIGTGCKKENLSPVPQTVLSDVTAFQSPLRIQQNVFGVYSALKSGQFLGGRALVYQDVRGEDWLNVTTNGVTAFGVWNFSITEGDNQVENFWSAGYATINRANVVLEGIDANPGVIPASLATQYKAEVRFVRALSYFYLQSLYARRPYNADNGASLSVPLRLTPNKSPEGAALARSTQAQVFTQILDDLNFAETNLPGTYGAAGDSNVVRAHKNAAIAMKMRVYMHMNRWADVITEGNKLVSASAPFQSPSNITHRLATTALAPFRSPYTNAENIFSMPMSVTNSPGTQNGLGGYWTNEFSLNPNGILGSASFPATDARRTNFVTTTNPARWTKFNDDLNNYVPIIRYAEVMLNLAEALARQAAGTSVDARALALLNAVRNRADASVSWNPANKTELINAILTERRIEFLGEGFRSLDVMRQGIDFPAKGSVSSVPASSVSYVWPIPASELQLNPLMVRNN